MSPTTGKHLSCQQWTAIPMPNSVIATVEAHAEAKKQPLIEGGCPRFEWHPNIPFVDGPDGHPDLLDILAGAATNAMPMANNIFDRADVLPNADISADDIPPNMPVIDCGLQHAGHSKAPYVHNVIDVIVSTADDGASAVSQERALGVEDDNDNIDPKFIADGIIEEQMPLEEEDAGDSMGDDADNSNSVSLIEGATEETPDLPWDEVSPIDDPPAISQPAPHYNLCPTRGCLYDHMLALNMNASSGMKSYDLHVQLLQLASNNMEMFPGNMFSYILAS